MQSVGWGNVSIFCNQHGGRAKLYQCKRNAFNDDSQLVWHRFPMITDSVKVSWCLMSYCTTTAA
eukprot:scaffold933_cov190-Alexandrium_tamarense.AAC.18